MTDRTSPGPASFSGHDRRRLALMLKQTSDARLFRRVQAVLRIAEGDPIRSVARSLRVSGRSVQRWVEI
jgi:transposase-like protein